MARDYHAEYERRNEIAREWGWESAYQEHKAWQILEDNPNLADRWNQAVDDFDLGREDEAAFYDAFINPETSHDMGIDSAKAYWFVEITEQVESYDDWAELYGED